jgi:hypothetical protein
VKKADLRELVKAAVDDRDPEKLLETGCPPDEYDDEVDDFVAAILRGDRMSSASVAATWERWFEAGSIANEKDFEALATTLSELQERWQREGGQ